MAGGAFRKVGRPGERRGSVVDLDGDRALVEAARTDPRAFEPLYRKYLAQVYSYAYYELRDHHDAEDVAERTFMAALTNLARFEERPRQGADRGASTFRVWLFRIARNAVADRRRAERRRPQARLESAEGIPSDADIETEVTRRAEASAAMDAVNRLPADRRRAVILRFVEEMSTAEIAGVLGRSEGAVRVLLHRALRSVARDLGVDRR